MIRLYSDNEFKQGVMGFYPFEYTVDPVSRVIGAPLETGRVSFDQKVIDPVRITMIGKVINENGLGADDTIEEMFQNRNYKFYSVELDNECYKNLVLQKATHRKQTNEMDVVTYTLEFVEAMIVQNNQKTPANANDSKTKQTGYTAPQKVA